MLSKVVCFSWAHLLKQAKAFVATTLFFSFSRPYLHFIKAHSYFFLNKMCLPILGFMLCVWLVWFLNTCSEFLAPISQVSLQPHNLCIINHNLVVFPFSDCLFI